MSLQSVTAELPGKQRAYPRFRASELRGLRTARVKYGQEVSVIDLSAGGVLFQTTGDLTPDSTIVLEFSGATRTFLVPSRVVRCQRLGTFEETPRLQGACAFRRPLPLDDLMGEARPETRPTPAATQAPPRDTALLAGWQLVVGNFRDGRVMRGYTNDFNPMKPYLHVSPSPQSDETKFVSMIHLDALFFLRDSQQTGTAGWDPSGSDSLAARGRKVAMTLTNGTELVGTTLTYTRDGSGFFVRPADDDGSARLVFVTQSGIRNIRFL